MGRRRLTGKRRCGRLYAGTTCGRVDGQIVPGVAIAGFRMALECVHKT